jgi:hypothetical protein
LVRWVEEPHEVEEGGIVVVKPKGKKYRDKNQGSHDFQIDLGIFLLKLWFLP